MDLSTFIGLAVLFFILTLAVSAVRRRFQVSELAATPLQAGDYGESGLDLASAAAFACAVPRTPDQVPHPKTLRSNPDFESGVELFLAPDLDPYDIAEAVYNDDPVVACMAIEALARRDDGPGMRDRLSGYLAWVPPWPGYFILRYLATVTPDGEPLIGSTLAAAANQLSDGQMRTYLEDFVRTRTGGGETPQFAAGTRALSVEQFDALKAFLEGIDQALGEQFAAEAAPLCQSDADLDLLRSIGDVWDAERASAAGDIVEHEALTEAVGEASAALLGPQGRSLLLVGEDGVGKATTIALLARRLHDQGWTIFEAGHAELVAGQTYIGQLEERVQLLVRELGRSRRVLWIITDFHNLAFSGLHKYNPVSVLDTVLPHVRAGKMTIVGAVSSAAYEKLVTWSPPVATALTVRRMGALPEAVAKDLAIAWLDRHADPKGDHKATVAESWELAGQFLTNASAPGNILKLLDLTRQRLTADGADKRPVIDVDEITLTLSQLTGLPVGLLDERRRLDLDGLERTFNRRVMGQPEAVQCLVERVAMIKAGLTDPGRPAGVFLFAGPTGTGKTEIAKTLTEWLFGSDSRMIRLDMSEFQTADDLGRIVGEAGGSDSEALVGKIRKQPFSVILLDEFEKAHARVWDIFLQVFDDGRLTGRSGQTTDFRHAIIILTSNLGAVIPTGVPLGFRDSGGGFDAGAVMQTIEREFRKEFINRLDRVVVFRPLTRDLMRQILEKELTASLKRRGLRSRPWAVEWDEAAIEFLLRQGFTPDLGARPLKRAIERFLLSPLAITIVKHKVPAGDQFLFVTRKGDGLDVQFVDPDAPETVDEEAEGAADAPGRIDGMAITLTGIALDPHGAPAEIALLQSEYDGLREQVNAPEWRDPKAEALASMQNPDFWTSAERFATLDMIERRDRVESALRRAGSLLQRVAGRKPGGKRDAYPVRLVGLLGQNLHLLKLATADIRNGQPGDAIIRVTGAGRNAGAGDHARDIARMYRAWAKKRSMRFRVLEEKHDEKSGGYSLVAAVDGFGAYAILAREHGLHVFERQAKNAKKPDRCRVSVEVSPQGRANGADELVAVDAGAARALGNGGAGPSLKIVRRYRKTRSPLVRDSVAGWRTGRLDLVLGGDFDLMQAAAR